jgi:hypothetical protein
MGPNSDTNIDDIKADILLNTIKRARPPIHDRHISCDEFINNIPRRLQGDAKKALKELIREGYVIRRKSSKKGYGKCSINHKKIGEILKIPQIREFSKKDPFLEKRIEDKFFKHVKE